MIAQLGVRRWVAWKLVQLAARIYDTELTQHVLLCNDDGVVVSSVGVIGDAYGNGIVGGATRLLQPVTRVRYVFDAESQDVVG